MMKFFVIVLTIELLSRCQCCDESQDGGVTTSPTSSNSCGCRSDNGNKSLHCIAKVVDLCTEYNAQYNEVAEYYMSTKFKNAFGFAFVTSLRIAQSECDAILKAEVIRLQVVSNDGQLGPSSYGL